MGKLDDSWQLTPALQYTMYMQCSNTFDIPLAALFPWDHHSLYCHSPWNVGVTCIHKHVGYPHPLLIEVLTFGIYLVVLACPWGHCYHSPWSDDMAGETYIDKSVKKSIKVVYIKLMHSVIK